MVRMTAIFISFHNLEPLLQIHGKAAACGVLQARDGAITEPDQRGTRRCRPALLWCCDQNIYTTSFHIYPESTGRHTIKYKQAINLAYGLGDGFQVAVWQAHT